MEGQISDPCQAQFWVKQPFVPPPEPDAENRESSVMGDWGGDESDGSVDLESVLVEPDFRRAERPEEVQTRVSETLEAMML